jgi:hypothetical protein
MTMKTSSGCFRQLKLLRRRAKALFFSYQTHQIGVEPIQRLLWRQLAIHWPSGVNKAIRLSKNPLFIAVKFSMAICTEDNAFC